MRDLVRVAVEEWVSEQGGPAHCVANLSYIYSPDIRSLAHRLSELQRANHDLIAATTLVHLNHKDTLESVLLKGPIASVRAFADQVRAKRGVRFGAINLVRVEADDQHGDPNSHTHPGAPHYSPRQG